MCFFNDAHKQFQIKWELCREIEQKVEPINALTKWSSVSEKKSHSYD